MSCLTFWNKRRQFLLEFDTLLVSWHNYEHGSLLAWSAMTVDLKQTKVEALNFSFLSITC